MKMKNYLVLLSFVLLSSVSMENITIAIIGTNDIHGSALPTSLKRSDNG